MTTPSREEELRVRTEEVIESAQASCKATQHLECQEYYVHKAFSDAIIAALLKTDAEAREAGASEGIARFQCEEYHDGWQVGCRYCEEERAGQEEVPE